MQNMKDRENARTVYSSAAGRICRSCGQPERGCRCGEPSAEAVPVRPIAKLRMERAGRGGKTVTVVFGLPNNEAFLKDLAKDLKKACGTGGSVTTEGVELQGDLRDRVRDFLIARGFGVKG
jgi:translation initiation factor 1